MLGTVALTPRRLDDYAGVLGAERIADVRRLAAPVRGLRMLGLSLTGFGSWVTDLLGCSIPLLRDLGIDASWQVLRAGHESEPSIVALYDAINGDASGWNADTRRGWQEFIGAGSAALDPRYDVVVIHDPQLAGLAPAHPPQAGARGTRWVWNCHVDMSGTAPAAWEDLRLFAEGCDAVVFEDAAFAPPGWRPRLVQIIPPGIDPLGPRNVPMPLETAGLLVGKLGIDHTRPLIAQISPFDTGSDALGLIEVYDALLPRFPGLQLAIIPTSLRDDQDTRAYFNAVARLANDRAGCVLLSMAEEIGNAEVNAFRQVADVVVQKSLRRGFALWLSEAMWQRRPVVAGRTAGTTAQVVDGATGYIVPDTAACAERVAELLLDEGARSRLGDNGHDHVANHFLVTRYLADMLQLLARLTKTGVGV